MIEIRKLGHLSSSGVCRRVLALVGVYLVATPAIAQDELIGVRAMDPFCNPFVGKKPKLGETRAVSDFDGSFIVVATSGWPNDEEDDEALIAERQTKIELFKRENDQYVEQFDDLYIYYFPVSDSELHVSSNGSVVVGPIRNEEGLFHTIEVYSPDGSLRFKIDHLDVDYSSFKADCLPRKPWYCPSLPIELFEEKLYLYDLNGHSVNIDLLTGEAVRGQSPSLACRATPEKLADDPDN